MKPKTCNHKYAPELDKKGNRRTALERTVLRQGTTSVPVLRFDKIVRVKCKECGKVRWLNERKLDREAV